MFCPCFPEMTLEATPEMDDGDAVIPKMLTRKAFKQKRNNYNH